MFDRFTERARKVMELADQEARRFNHEYIGTEHILLGLVREAAIVITGRRRFASVCRLAAVCHE